MDKTKSRAGFTLIEIIVVTSIFIILFGISTISLTNLVPRANFVTSHQSILSDIKSQQHKAMTGSVDESGNGSAYGIHLENNQYTLFTGSVYDSNSPGNFVIQFTPDLSLTEIAFTAGDLIFLQNSGEVSGFGDATSSFKLTNIDTNEEKLINLNWLGVVLQN